MGADQTVFLQPDTVNLVQRAQNEESWAVKRLLDLFAPLLINEAKNFRHVGYDFEDLLQDARLEFVALLKSYDISRGVYFETYIKRNLHFRLHNRYRAEKSVHTKLTRQSPEDPEMEEEEYIALLVAEQQNDGADESVLVLEGLPLFEQISDPRIAASLQELTEKQHHILTQWLRFDLIDAEIAESIGTTRQNVTALRNAALSTIREALGIQTMKVSHVKLEQINQEDKQFQFRYAHDERELEELAASIESEGQIHPVILRRPKGGRYQIICGFRRVAALAKLGKETVCALVVDVSDEMAYRLSIAENRHRKNLSPMEIALTCDRLKNELGKSYAEIGELLGIKPKTIQRYLRLLTLADEVKQALHQGKIQFLHGLELAKVDNDVQSKLLEEILHTEMSVRRLRKRIEQENNARVPSKSTAAVLKTVDFQKESDGCLLIRIKSSPNAREGLIVFLRKLLNRLEPMQYKKCSECLKAIAQKKRKG